MTLNNTSSISLERTTTAGSNDEGGKAGRATAEVLETVERLTMIISQLLSP